MNNGNILKLEYIDEVPTRLYQTPRGSWQLWELLDGCWHFCTSSPKPGRDASPEDVREYFG